MIRFVSLLRRLWPLRPKASPRPAAFVGGRGAPAGEVDVAPIPLPSPPTPAAPPSPEPPPAAPSGAPANPYATIVSNDNLTADQEDEEDEAGGDEDGDEPLDDEEIGPDPFVKAQAPAAAPMAEREIALERRAARAEALRGQHRIYISTVAGPGSLAEALNTLLTEGLVTAEFIDQGQEASCILYTPALRRE